MKFQKSKIFSSNP